MPILVSRLRAIAGCLHASVRSTTHGGGIGRFAFKHFYVRFECEACPVRAYYWVDDIQLGSNPALNALGSLAGRETVHRTLFNHALQVEM